MSKTYPLMLAVDCGVSDCGEGDSQPGALGRSDSPVAGTGCLPRGHLLRKEGRGETQEGEAQEKDAQDETAEVSGPGETFVFPILIPHLETPVPTVFSSTDARVGCATDDRIRVRPEIQEDIHFRR